MTPHIPLTGNFIVWWNCRSKPEHQSKAEQSRAPELCFQSELLGVGHGNLGAASSHSLISNPFPPPSCHAARSVGRTSASNNRKWDESNWPAAAPHNHSSTPPTTTRENSDQNGPSPAKKSSPGLISPLISYNHIFAHLWFLIIISLFTFDSS